MQNENEDLRDTEAVLCILWQGAVQEELTYFTLNFNPCFIHLNHYLVCVIGNRAE